MTLYTFQARSLADALRLVRAELGADACVLHTREIGSPLARLICGRMIEVTASAEPCAPSRLPDCPTSDIESTAIAASRIPSAELQDFRRKFRKDLMNQELSGISLVEERAQRQFADVAGSSN